MAIALGWIVVLALSGLVRCTGPCRALADVICQCQRTEAERRSCRERVGNNSDTPTAAEDEACSGFLDTCTCASLDVEDLEACGLSNPDEVP
jgi:hypothetical protein